VAERAGDPETAAVADGILSEERRAAERVRPALGPGGGRLAARTGGGDVIACTAAEPDLPDARVEHDGSARWRSAAALTPCGGSSERGPVG
jgi:hypothetical protein